MCLAGDATWDHGGFLACVPVRAMSGPVETAGVYHQQRQADVPGLGSALGILMSESWAELTPSLTWAW